MVTAPEACEHFVVDGAARRRDGFQTQLATDQGSEIPAPRRSIGKVAHVDGQQIHGNATDDGAAPAGNDRLRRRLAFGGPGGAHVSVGIADRHDCKPAWPGDRECRTVADGLTLLALADLNNAALQLDHRAHGVLLPRDWIGPVERAAGTHHVAVDRAAEKYPGRIGERGRDPAIRDAELAEKADLLLIQ